MRSGGWSMGVRRRLPRPAKIALSALRLPVLRALQSPARHSVFIAGAQRSGGNLLCTAIRQTGLLGSPTEYFDRETIAARLGFADISYRDCAVLAIWYGTTPNGVTSSKIFWPEFCALGQEVNIDRWFPKRQWILLRRRDQLAQAISLAIAYQTMQWASRDKPRGTPVYSRPDVVERLSTIKNSYENWDRYFAAKATCPLTLWYEDIAVDLHSAVRAIARFVGGHVLEAEVEHSPPFVDGHFDHDFEIQRSRVNEEWRSRFEEGRDGAPSVSDQ